MADPNGANRPKRLTVAEVAEIVRVDQRRVLGWIDRGELVAENVADRKDGQRPRWRVLESDLDAFLAGRRTVAPAPPIVRRQREPESVTKYY